MTSLTYSFEFSLFLCYTVAMSKEITISQLSDHAQSISSHLNQTTAEIQSSTVTLPEALHSAMNWIVANPGWASVIALGIGLTLFTIAYESDR